MTGRSVWACFALSFCLFILFESPLVLAGSDDLGDSTRSNREKRAPFSSWAGKRSSGEELSSAELDQLVRELEDIYELHRSVEGEEASGVIKRAPFSSWAGKRAPFSSWAGKRAPFSSWAGKRAPFSSWAGKRSIVEDDELMAMQQQANAGHRIKRSSAEFELDDEIEGGASQVSNRVRRGAGFSAWGGKRSLTEINDESSSKKRVARNTNAVEEGHRVVRPARAAFSAWGGK